jgi:hypothetical protein
MGTPITPRALVDEVVLARITVLYDPQWDGANWTVDPAGILVGGSGFLTEDETGNGEYVMEIAFNDLPVGAQTALQQLYGFIEAEMAAELG